MEKKQKAQGIVEFALILPLFLLLVMGIMYFGFALSDYLTMNNFVRSVAHEASLQTDSAGYKEAIENNASQVTLLGDMFIWKPNVKVDVIGENSARNDAIEVKYHKKEEDEKQNTVIVTATAKVNNDSVLGSVMNNLMDKKDGEQAEIKIEYSMYTTRKQ